MADMQKDALTVPALERRITALEHEMLALKQTVREISESIGKPVTEAIGKPLR